MNHLLSRKDTGVSSRRETAASESDAEPDPFYQLS
jgi:hypothetical protein